VLCVVSGGNIDVTTVARIIDRGLVFDGRMTRLRVTVRDRPGGVARVTRIAADAGANVVEIFHRRAFADITVGDVEIELQLETRGRDHVQELIGRFTEAGLGVEEAL
jgi:threonine dehydratase